MAWRSVFRTVGVVFVTAALTWALAHRFYMKQFRSAQLQILTAADLPLATSGSAVTAAAPITDATTGMATYWRMDVSFRTHGTTVLERSARADMDLTLDKRYGGGPVDLHGRRILLFYRAPQSLQGGGRHLNRMQIELHDMDGRVMRGPFQPILLADQMMPLEFRPYDDVPIPLGYMETGFDLSRVRRIGVRLRIDQFANQLKPAFYPAKGSIVISPVFIAPNDTNEHHGMLNLFDHAKMPELPPIPSHPEPFIIGINYPWRNYGSDFGHNPWSEDPQAHDGLSVHVKELARDFASLREHGVTVIRLFVFCDLRTGLTYGPDKKLTGFDPFVVGDMQALLETARAQKVRLVLTLLNFDLVDGVQFNGSGEHQDFVLDPAARQTFLEKCLAPLLETMTPYQDVIYAVDPMNEPEHALLLTNHENFEKLSGFLYDIAALTRTKLPTTRISLGSANRQLSERFWKEFPDDTVQFHFYQQMGEEEGVPFDYPAEKVSAKPVLIGETEGDDVAGRLNAAKRNGYAGVLFWSMRGGDGYTVDLNAIGRWSLDQQ